MSQTPFFSPGCPIRVGDTIAGRYVIRGVLGVGTTGWVLKVTDSVLSGEPLAFKIFHPHLLADEQSVLRLRQEFVLARQLSHPRIVQVHDFQQLEDGTAFLSMDFVPGVNLGELLDGQSGRRIAADEAVIILMHIAEALQYAHRQRIVHRDLKPSNVLVGYDGGARLADFGIAKCFTADLGLTRTGEAPGTPEYMAPEQFRSESADERSDIYAFGILAFELFTGRTPFGEEDYYCLAEKHLHTPLPAISDDRSDVPPQIQELVSQCCAKDPGTRPQSMDEILARLRPEAPERAVVRVRRPAARFWNRMPVVVRRSLLSAVALLAVLGLFIGAYWQTNFRIAMTTWLLITEYRLGVELTPLKAVLGINVSVSRPETIFDALRSSDKWALRSLIDASNVVQFRASHPNVPSFATMRDGNGDTPLNVAVQMDKKELIEPFEFVHNEDEPLSSNGETSLTLAILRHNKGALTTLASLPFLPLETPNAQGDMPLHVAVLKKENWFLDKLLHDRVANPNVTNRLGLTPFEVAIAAFDWQCLRHMTAMRTIFRSRDLEGRAPIMLALELSWPPQMRMAMVDFLLREDPDVSKTLLARNVLGQTALIVAAQKSHDEVYYRLVQEGADRSARDTTGRRAVDYARESGQSESDIAVLEEPEPKETP